MEYVRLLHQRHFDPRKNRFIRLAFKNIRGSSSIIHHECILRTSIPVCVHIRKYYTGIAGNPAIFWIFEEDRLPPGGTLEQHTTESGDECHYNVHGITDEQYAEFLKEHQRTQGFLNFYVCATGEYRPLERHDLPPS